MTRYGRSNAVPPAPVAKPPPPKKQPPPPKVAHKAPPAPVAAKPKRLTGELAAAAKRLDGWKPTAEQELHIENWVGKVLDVVKERQRDFFRACRNAVVSWNTEVDKSVKEGEETGEAPYIDSPGVVCHEELAEIEKAMPVDAQEDQDSDAFSFMDDPVDASPTNGRHQPKGDDAKAPSHQRRRIGAKGDQQFVVVENKEKPNSGELTYEEAKKVGIVVEVHFKDFRSLIRTVDGSFSVQCMNLQVYITTFSSATVRSSPIAWLEPWAILVTSHPSLFLVWEGVVKLVATTKPRTVLDIADGLPKEILGVMVRCFIEKRRAMRRVRDPKEKTISFANNVGNLICDKADLTAASKLEVEHSLTICEIAWGSGYFLPDTPEDAYDTNAWGGADEKVTPVAVAQPVVG